MRKFLPLLLLFTIFGAFSQNKDSLNVVQQIMVNSDGNILIDIPQPILSKVLQPQNEKKTDKNLKPGINRLAGYRIQVFSDGRNQSSLESRARSRGNMVLAKFPKYKGQVYTFSSSPNWYTRVGNFRTSEEAQKALTELKQAFPNFASEMRIVKSQIVVIK